MLPSHMLRMVKICVSGDYFDPAVREKIKRQCIPILSKHRREVLAGSYSGRQSRPTGFASKMLADAKLIRRTLMHAHQHLMKAEPITNVVSFNSPSRRRSVAAAASA